MNAINPQSIQDLISKDQDLFNNESRLTYQTYTDSIIEAGMSIVDIFKTGGKLFVCGNGGSAADAQHISAELTGFFDNRSRRGLPAIALHCDVSALTAVANDLDYTRIYSRQLESLRSTESKDALLGISTSGNSLNIIEAFNTAGSLGMTTIAILGHGGGKCKGMSDIEIIAKSDYTPRIQGIHSRIYHHICKIIDLAYS
jgi:D-sedoheptulose 7-phosphate isomerase